MEKQITIEELRPGMFVHKLQGSWVDRLLWKSEFLIEDSAEVQQIRSSGLRKVWIDTERGADVAQRKPQGVEGVPANASEPEPVAAEPKPSRQATGFSEELERAQKICLNAKRAVNSMFNEARMGKAVEAGRAKELVEEISASVERNTAALISLARLKTKDDYTYMHSVAVCGLMIALSRQLERNEEDIRAAGLAGLMHDVGKMAVPSKILNKPGRLTDEEYRLVKLHPERGHELLQQTTGIDPVTMDVCLHHHERVDGRGYPHGLNGDQISLFAKMGAVCDVYDAVTSNRPYKAGWDPAESLQKMAGWSKGDYEAHVFQAFVKSVGIYPTGTLLRLESGRLGIVMEQSGKSLLQPRVKVFYSTKSNSYVKPEVIDLSHPGSMDGIVGPEAAAKWGLRNLDELWAGDAAPR